MSGRKHLIGPVWLLGLTIACGWGCQRQPSSTNPAAGEQPSKGHVRMVQRLAKRKEASLDSNQLFGDGDLREAEAVLERPRLSDWERFGASYLAGIASKRLGRNAEAVTHLRTAYQLIQDTPAAVQARIPGIEHETLFELAGAYLRYGEVQNCIACQNSDSCIFPIQGAGIHTEQAGSRSAVQCLERLLEEDPDHLGAKWLLNIAQMTLGGYPDAVPEEHRMPPDRFASDVEFPRFVNIADRVGLNTVTISGGAIVDDFDGDDFLDVVVSERSDAGPLRFFRNTGAGKFEEKIDEAGIRGLYGGLNLVQADYDNDGDLDILILRGGWRPRDGDHINSLLQNDGRAFFRDVTFEAGLGGQAYPSHTGAWGDYDNDGDLDLFVGNEEFPCQLFENNGRGRFADVAARAGVENNRFTKSAVWGDYDSDGYPDLYVSNYGAPTGGGGMSSAQKGQPNRLYHNNRNGTFTDVAEELGVTRPLLSFPIWFWDYNNDGALDLFVATYDGTVETVAAEAFQTPNQYERCYLYQGDGAGNFQEVGEARNLDFVSLTMGSNFGDLNNDGFLDMFLGTGHPAYEALVPNLMFLNHEGERFLDVTTAGGFGHLQKGHGIAFADVDNDGDQDVFAEMGGAFPGDTAANALFENPGFDHHWICIQLVGSQTNRCAIGARLSLEIDENGGRRSLYRWVSSGGSFGANPLRQEIGLGRAAVVRNLEVYWPTSGKKQQFENVPVDQWFEIREEDGQLRPKKHKSW